LHASNIGTVFLLMAYVLALLVVCILFKEIWLAGLLSSVLLCALAYYLCRDVRLIFPSSYIKLRVETDSIVMLLRNGGQISARLAGDSLVTPVLTVLNLLPEGKQKIRSVLIFPDSMEKDQFRELRVLLKWESEVT